MFYQRIGYLCEYPIEEIYKEYSVAKNFGYTDNSLVLDTLRHNRKRRDFSSFSKVLDTAKPIELKQDFLPYIAEMFEWLADITEPIYRINQVALQEKLLFPTVKFARELPYRFPKSSTKYTIKV